MEDLYFKTITQTVCDYYYIQFDVFMKLLKRRKREFVQARQISMYFLGKYTPYSNEQIAGFYLKDHSSYNHSKKTVNNLNDSDKIFAKDIEFLNKIIAENLEKAISLKKELDNKKKDVELQNIELGKLKITGVKIDNKWSFTAKKHGRYPITMKDILDCKKATKIENLTAIIPNQQSIYEISLVEL